MMTSQEFKQKCIELRNQNFTLGEMVKILGRPKTTIFFHISNLPRSKILQEKISAISSKYAKLNHSRGLTPQKGKSALGRKYKEFAKWTPDLVNLVAHALFDGEIKYGGVIYNNRCKILIDGFESKMKLVYNFEPKFYLNKDGVRRISYYNVELGSYFKSKKDKLLIEIITLPREFQREFLRAFFDDEGSVDFRGKERRVKGYQYTDGILFLVQALLKNFEIISRVSTRFHELIISRRENIEKFAKEINFTKGIRVNGNRSNSVWKKSLEKRRILSMAISSYQTVN